MCDQKFTKAEVNYKKSDDPRQHRCGMCTYHLHVPGTDHLECGIVAGSIHDDDGCKLFDIDLIEAALYPTPKPHDR